MGRKRYRPEEIIGKLREAEVYMKYDVPAFIRSDNGPEFTAGVVRNWLSSVGSMALFIEPGSPWEKGYIENYNGKMRDELLNGELFETVLEAQVLTDDWREHYNKLRPHSALGYRPPAPEAVLMKDQTLHLNQRAG